MMRDKALTQRLVPSRHEKNVKRERTPKVKVYGLSLYILQNILQQIIKCTSIAVRHFRNLFAKVY